MSRSFLKFAILFGVLHWLVLIGLEAGAFLLAHLPTSVLRLDFPILGLTKLIQVLRWPRLVLMAVWPGETTPGFLHLTLTILNSLIWGIGLAGLKVLWSKMRS